MANVSWIATRRAFRCRHPVRIGYFVSLDGIAKVQQTFDFLLSFSSTDIFFHSFLITHPRRSRRESSPSTDIRLEATNLAMVCWRYFWANFLLRRASSIAVRWAAACCSNACFCVLKSTTMNRSLPQQINRTLMPRDALVSSAWLSNPPAVDAIGSSIVYPLSIDFPSLSERPLLGCNVHVRWSLWFEPSWSRWNRTWTNRSAERSISLRRIEFRLEINQHVSFETKFSNNSGQFVGQAVDRCSGRRHWMIRLWRGELLTRCVDLWHNRYRFRDALSDVLIWWSSLWCNRSIL